MEWALLVAKTRKLKMTRTTTAKKMALRTAKTKMRRKRKTTMRLRNMYHTLTMSQTMRKKRGKIQRKSQSATHSSHPRR